MSGIEMMLAASLAAEFVDELCGTTPLGSAFTMRTGVVLDGGTGKAGGILVMRGAEKLISAMFCSWLGISSFGSAMMLG